MEKLTIILLSFSTLLNVCLIYFLKKSFLKVKDSKQQLDELKGQSLEDLYEKGKFSELGALSAGITHEISTPLTIILGKLTKLMKMEFTKLTTEQLETDLNQIKKQTERIATIIQSVRQYIYRDEQSMEDFISLKEIIDHVLLFYGQRLKNHEIELRLKDIDKAFVSGHKGQYEQAILNLISNSFDAVDKLPEKWIEISTVNTEDDVQIFIKDSGHGIPVDVQKKMLVPFYSTKKGTGNGLGLTLVKGIAERHGGDLKYIDAPNTTFMLELPKASSLHYHH